MVTSKKAILIEKRHILNWWVIVLVSGLLFLIEFVELDQPLRKPLEQVLQPGQRLAAQVATALQQPVNWVTSTHQTARKIQDLEIRYSEALAQLGEMQAIQEENQTLRQMLQNSDRSLTPTVIAAPIVSYGVPYINSGEAEGVTVSDMVLVAQALVGRVAKTTPHQSEVMLLSHPNSKPVLVKTESGATGIVVGNGKHMLLKEILSEVALQPGERVITTGQEGIAPDLLVGRIGTIKEDISAATQEATVEEIVSFYEARVVEIRQN